MGGRGSLAGSSHRDGAAWPRGERVAAALAWALLWRRGTERKAGLERKPLGLGSLLLLQWSSPLCALPLAAGAGKDGLGVRRWSPSHCRRGRLAGGRSDSLPQWARGSGAVTPCSTWEEGWAG